MFFLHYSFLRGGGGFTQELKFKHFLAFYNSCVFRNVSGLTNSKHEFAHQLQRLNTI